MLDGARTLLRARPSQLQGIVTEVAPRWLARQCCTPQQLLERVRAQPSWQVTCSGLPPGQEQVGAPPARGDVPGTQVGRRASSSSGKRTASQEPERPLPPI